MSELTTPVHAIDEYLHALDLSLRDLPSDRRREIVSEIREHIGEALSSGGSEVSEVAVGNVLERMGDPEEIADDARQRFGLARREVTWQDWLVPVLLPFGTFLALFGWLAGVVLLWKSKHFARWEKIVATAVWPFGLALPLYAGAFIAGFASGPADCIERPGGVTECRAETTHVVFSWSVQQVLMTLAFVAPLAVAAYLTVRLLRVRRGLRH